MFIDQLTNADATPVLRAVAQFTAQRQKLIAGNIANFSTPGYLARDVSVRGFQEQLCEAIEEQRTRVGPDRAELKLRSTHEVRVTENGLELVASTPEGNILCHDRNNRDLERSMQDLSENVAMFRLATDLLKSRAALLEAAIRERV